MEDKYCLGCEEKVVEKKPPCPLSCMSPKCDAYKNRTKIDPEVTPIIWVLGGPGCGKETQCKKIVALYGFTHLSTGDLLRAEINSGSDRGKCLTSIMERGGLVPNDIVISLVKEKMIELAPTCKGFLIDGYPREKSQGMQFEKMIAPCSGILYFEASRETLLNRLTTRALTSGRADDNTTTIQIRLQTFSENNNLVIEQYKDKLMTISAEGTPDAIFEDVKKHLDPIARRAEEAKIAKQNAAMAAAGTPAAATAASATAEN